MVRVPILSVVGCLVLVCTSAGGEDLGLLPWTDIINDHFGVPLAAKIEEVQDEALENLPVSERQYDDLEVLGFVKPWNRDGEKVAVDAVERGVIDVVSPVTISIHPNFTTNGGDQFDDDFYSSLRNGSHPSKIYPRVYFEGQWYAKAFYDLVVEENVGLVVENIANAAKNVGADGVVLEFFPQLLDSGFLRFKSFAEQTLASTIQIGADLKAKGLDVVLVLPPLDAEAAEKNLVPLSHLHAMAEVYDRFVVKTYGLHAPGGDAGPVAPLPWCEKIAKFLVHDAKLGKKLLLGINFYGLEFPQIGKGGRHLIRQEYIKILLHEEPDITWIDEYGEDAFGYEGMHIQQRVVFYPTSRSIRARLDMAREVGCGGVAIWELGQGLYHFTSLL